MVQIIPKPPAGFGATFLEWLVTTNERLEAGIVETPGLCEAEVGWLEQQLGMPLPVDFRTFYQHCNPWGIWSRPQEQWQLIREKIATDNQLGQGLLPVDINNRGGNHVVALVRPDGSYQVSETDDYRLASDRGGSLREYFMGPVEGELRYVEWLNRLREQKDAGPAEPNAAPHCGGS